MKRFYSYGYEKKILRKQELRDMRKEDPYLLILTGIDEFEPKLLEKELSGNEEILAIGFHRCHNLVDSDLEFLKTLPNIKQVYVHDCNVNGSFLKYLKNSDVFYLDVGYWHFARDNYRFLCGMPLRMVDFTMSSVEDSIFEYLSEIDTLNYLDIILNRFEGSKIKKKGFSQFKGVSLTGCANVASILDTMLDDRVASSLCSLNLIDCKLKDSDIAKITTKKNLTNLNVSFNPDITDKSTEYIGKLPKLVDLDVSETSFTSKGFERLSKEPAAASLRIIYAVGNEGFSVKQTSNRANFPSISQISCGYSIELKRELQSEGFICESKDFYSKCDDGGNVVVIYLENVLERKKIYRRYHRLRRNADFCLLV